MRLLLAIIAAVLTWPAQAQFSATMPFGSYHQGHPNDHCEINPGIGVEYAVVSDVFIVGVGVYRNSECERTKYIRGRSYLLHFGRVSLGIMYALVQGYAADGRWQVLPPLPSVRLGVTRNTSVNTFIVPPLPGHHYVFGFEVEHSF